MRNTQCGEIIALKEYCNAYGIKEIKQGGLSFTEARVSFCFKKTPFSF